MTDTRDAVAESVEIHPGIHFSELVRELDLGQGQVQYHLRQLRSERAVVAERLYGRTHYYPPEFDDWERRALALLQRETAGDIVAYLLTHGPARPAAVAADLDIARSTLEWHLDHLETGGVVDKRRNDRNEVTLRLSRPTDTVRLVRDADPSVRERLIGRFTRLVDRLL